VTLCDAVVKTHNICAEYQLKSKWYPQKGWQNFSCCRTSVAQKIFHSVGFSEQRYNDWEFL